MKNNSSWKEKRRHSRVPIKIPVFVKSAQSLLKPPLSNLSNKKAIMRNISENGMLLEYKKDLKILETLKKIEESKILNNEAFELNLELAPPSNKLLLNVNVIPVWAKIESDSPEDNIKLGARFPAGTSIKIVFSENKLGLCFEMTTVKTKEIQSILQSPKGIKYLKEIEKPEVPPSYDAMKHYYRGILFYSTGEYDISLEEFKEALSLGYDSAELHNKLGEIYVKQKNFHKAQEEFKRALEINPFYMQAKHNIVDLKKTMK